MTHPATPFALIILDGFGLNPIAEGNAVLAANTPCFDSLWEQCPHTTLVTSGERVGLPAGQMGNSEVGHLNIGAGRVVYQDLSRINSAIANQQLTELSDLRQMARSTAHGATVHLAGLVSEGGVHSSLDHLCALLTALSELGALRVRVHCFSDGRDRPPQAARDEIEKLVETIRSLQAEYPSLDIAIASLCGRYFAMDRDNRWERTQQAYELLTEAIGMRFDSIRQAFEAFYTEDKTDEFLPPTTFSVPGQDDSMSLCDGDSLLFFNFRSDRMKQISTCFFAADADFTGFTRAKRPRLATIASLTEYDETFPLAVLFGPQSLAKHLGEVISDSGLRQVRVAETEKYAHVTYFFNGGEEAAFPGEERILIPSRRDVATYDLVPEMSAEAVAEAVCSALAANSYDFYIVNFANCDMVGHTGSFSAAVKACEAVDRCLDQVITALKQVGGTAIITADHGNADQMIDYATREPHTYHTTHPVPLILIEPESSAKLRKEQSTGTVLRDGGALCDIAPTILALLKIPAPAQMTGHSLLISND